MKFRILATTLAVLGSAFTVSAFDHSLFTQVLAAHVKDGLVDYDALKTDKRLPRYLAQLAATDPATLPNDRERLAFWLNAYNAYTLDLVVKKQPKRSITQIGTGGLVLGSVLKTTAWDIPIAVVGGRKYTLNEIEHEVIRAKFKDARAHFALNCASGSCPVLRTEAYEADDLDEQLDDQGRQFLADSTKNSFDLATKTAHLSSIFKWYQGDFGASDAQALLAAAKFAPPGIRNAIEADPKAWKVKFLAYDWSLNEAKK